MKKIIILIAIFVSICNLSNAQLIPLPQSGPIDTSNISLFNPTNSKKITYGEAAEKLIQAFGAPNSSEAYLFEMNEKVGTLYQYGTNKIYFMENKLYLFEINTSSILVKNGAYTLKVGDPITAMSNFYPNYILENNYVIAKIKNQHGEIDGSILVKTNGTNIIQISFNIH